MECCHYSSNSLREYPNLLPAEKMLAKNVLAKTEVACQFLQSMDSAEEQVLEKERVSIPQYTNSCDAMSMTIVLTGLIAGPCLMMSCIWGAVLGAGLGSVGSCLTGTAACLGTLGCVGGGIGGVTHCIKHKKSKEEAPIFYTEERCSRLKSDIRKIDTEIKKITDPQVLKQLQKVRNAFAQTYNFYSIPSRAIEII